jgi:3-deoxy-7-phosphoheptulonate synthase
LLSRRRTVKILASPSGDRLFEGSPRAIPVLRFLEVLPMLIVMKKDASPQEIEHVVETVRRMGLTPHPIPGTQRMAIGITGNKGGLEPQAIEGLPGVLEAIAVSKPFKQVSREWKAADTVVDVKGVKIGGPGIVVMAGPCAVESYEQTLAAALGVKAGGAHMLRGGAFKPRTSPYAFQGLGEPGLEILARVRDAVGLPVVTEAIDSESVALVERYADMIQIGARNMQNFSLLKRAGRSSLPVLLKRGMSATIEELLLAAEYIVSEGNPNVVLCERGVRTFADHTRNTLDLSAIPAVKRLSHLPILADPSHGTGRREKVVPMARAAVAAGADGLIIEVHHEPETALSDGYQSLLPDSFAELMEQLRRLAPVLGREVPRS